MYKSHSQSALKSKTHHKTTAKTYSKARPSHNRAQSSHHSTTHSRSQSSQRAHHGSAAYASWTRAELYEQAKKRNLQGRSTMSKAMLIKALSR